jgi:protein-S-isoprenylcysteine O-methyltransferase Ste14
LSSAWAVLYRAQRHHVLATTGIYAKIRHPQYVGFVLIMFGFLMQWPTIITLVMFPILVHMYVRLAQTEEKEAYAEFGDEYSKYAGRVPAFFPHL